MAVQLLRVYGGDGQTRAIWSDRSASLFRATATRPKRASRVEVIEDGPNSGRFGVDFTLLAEATGDERYRVCLTKAYDRYDEAVAAEVAWIRNNYLLESTHGGDRATGEAAAG